MGYSISVRPKYKKSLIKMWDFMQENYTEPKILFNQNGNYSRLALNMDKDNGLSYENNKYAIGFDYNACEPERDYIFSVIKWMAIKISKLYKIKNIGEVPCYIYDGYEIIPVFVKNIWKNIISKEYKHDLVNDIGFKSLSLRFVGVPAYEDSKNKKEWIEEHLRLYYDLTNKSWKEIDKIIHNELKRLNKKFTILNY